MMEHWDQPNPTAGTEWFMVVMTLLIVLALIVGVVMFLRSGVIHRHPRDLEAQDAAVNRLRQRLAEGDVTPEEFQRSMELLTSHSVIPGEHRP